ncbi:hypothetical protein [Archangium violaceum]|uniref:hypothetical protein n=1 Tax=Archangium violaceum TaxID=83451 RepID=UPI0037C127E3
MRISMSRLPLETAPDAGLESLLAYAQQSARRSAAGSELPPRWWRRLLAPALGVAAMSVLGVVVVQVNRDVNLSPVLTQEPAQKPSPRLKDKAEVAEAPAPLSAPVSPSVPADIGKLHAQYDEKVRDGMPAEPIPMKLAPKPVSRSVRSSDWSNAGAGSAGGFPEKKVALDSDDEASDLDARGSQESWKLKRGVVARKNWPSGPKAERAEPAQEEAALAGAEQANPEPQVQVSGESLLASGAPPPPPPSAQYQPSAAPAPAGAYASRASPSPAELLRQANGANRSGDREQEVAFLRAALAAGAQGAQLVDVLSRLCDAEAALGRRESAIEVCKRVVMMAPGSSEARLAQRRLERELQSPADEVDSEPKAASPMTK